LAAKVTIEVLADGICSPIVPQLIHVKTRGQSTVPFCLVTIQRWIGIATSAITARAA
jgi:hypothetical protein